MNYNLQALTDAIAIFDKLIKQTANGPMYPWALLKHGRDYLNSQIEAYFKEAA